MNRRITKRVEEVLARARVSTPPVDVMAVSELYDVDVKFGALPDDLSGFLIHEDDRVVIGVNSLHPKTRQRFTIAHELGHHLLHPRDNFVDRQLVFFRDNRSGQASDSREIEANQFAADLLMPEKLLFKKLRKRPVDLEDDEAIAALARVFAVSPQALTFRLANLNLAQ